MWIRKKEEMNPFPFWVYRLEMVALAVAGLYVSLHLTYTHYANYNILSYQSFCAISKAINCDTVAQSRFSILAGVPVAVWGILGYVCILFLLIPGFFRKVDDTRFWPVLFLLSCLCSIVSLIYGYISIKFIQSLCIMCLISYGVNFSMLLTSWITLRRYSISIRTGIADDFLFYLRNKKTALPVAGLFFVSVMALLLFYPPYWNFPDFPQSSLFHQGVTEDGHPWIGAENPVLTITEFTDYQCFPCKKTHLALRKLIQQYPDKIRLVHRHFPMDTKCNPLVKEKYHESAAIMAMIALCAGRHSKFWPVSDFLFYRDPAEHTINVKNLVESLGLDFEDARSCIYAPESFSLLLKDIHEGINRGVRVTPSFVINNELYEGWIPSEVLNRHLKETD